MRTIANRIGRKRMVLLLVAVILDACSIGPVQKTAPRTYLLDPEISFKNSKNDAGAASYGTLLVSPTRAQPGFDTPHMVYLLRPHEVSYYAFNQWADSPARMLTRLVVQALESTKLWRAVVQVPSPVPPDYRLDGDGLILEQQFFAKPSRVRLALRAQLIDAKHQSVIGARDFEVFEDAPTEDAYGGVVAANRATAKLLGELAAWVSTVMRDREPRVQ